VQGLYIGEASEPRGDAFGRRYSSHRSIVGSAGRTRNIVAAVGDWRRLRRAPL